MGDHFLAWVATHGALARWLLRLPVVAVGSLVMRLGLRWLIRHDYVIVHRGPERLGYFLLGTTPAHALVSWLLHRLIRCACEPPWRTVLAWQAAHDADAARQAEAEARAHPETRR